ncbi:MAG: UrcA family protein [Sphingomonas sp.]|nr:UrcA family protein [Sphingomonas sp.]
MTRNLLAFIGLLTLVFAAAFVALANGQSFLDEAPRKMAVSYKGLDLATDEGRKMLEARIKRALSTVCGNIRDTRQLKEQALIKQCRRDALAGTRPQVDRAVEVAIRRRQAADLAEATLQDQGTAAPTESPTR